MTDRDDDRDIWVYILTYDRDHGLTRFCIGIAVLAILGWLLIQILAA